MKRFVLIMVLCTACGSTESKGENAAANAGPNNANGDANVVANNDTTNNGETNTDPVNSTPAGSCDHAAPVAASAQTCRTSDECEYGCGYTDSGPGCGALMVPQQLCVSDEDCFEGSVCVPWLCGDDPCCEGQGTQCVPACQDQPCQDGFACSDDGHCSAISCEDGFSCDDGFVCDPSRADAHVDEHGCTVQTCGLDGAACPQGFMCDGGAAGNPNGTCLPIACSSDADCHPNEVCNPPGSIYASGCELATCASDADCGCGACIQERCQPRLFVCLSPAPP